METLLIATHNLGKVREYRALLADVALRLVTPAEVGVTQEVEETGATFAENAVLKARGYAELTGLWTWADDSGLAVDALAGRPGVHSARFGGDGLDDAARCRYLLERLRLSGAAQPWSAQFHCVVALALPPAPIATLHGALAGQIVETPLGEQGFGYDPVFFVPQLGKTLGQTPPEVKNRISHRAQAAQAAKRTLMHHLAECNRSP